MGLIDGIRQKMEATHVPLETEVNNIPQHTRKTPVKRYDGRRLGDTFPNEPPPDQAVHKTSYSF